MKKCGRVGENHVPYAAAVECFKCNWKENFY